MEVRDQVGRRPGSCRPGSRQRSVSPRRPATTAPPFARADASSERTTVVPTATTGRRSAARARDRGGRLGRDPVALGIQPVRARIVDLHGAERARADVQGERARPRARRAPIAASSAGVKCRPGRRRRHGARRSRVDRLVALAIVDRGRGRVPARLRAASMYGGSGSSPMSSSTASSDGPRPRQAQQRASRVRAARRPRPRRRRRRRWPRRGLVRRGPRASASHSSQNRSFRTAGSVVDGHALRQQEFDRPAGRLSARAGAPPGRARRSARAATAGGSSSRISRNRRCLRAPAAAIHDHQAGVVAGVGRGGGDAVRRKMNSKSAVCKPAALCNLLYKTRFSIIQSPSVPHMTILKAHFPTGTAFLERYLSDLGQRWAVLTRRAGRSRSARSSSSRSVWAAVAARR